MRDWEQAFIDKYDKGKTFTEEDLNSLACSRLSVYNQEGETHEAAPWMSKQSNVFRIKNRYFWLNWYCETDPDPCTRQLEVSFPEQPEEVYPSVCLKQVSVTEWLPVKRSIEQ